MRLTSEEIELLFLISNRHRNTLTLYIVTGPQTIPDFGPMVGLTKKLLDSICPFVGYTSFPARQGIGFPRRMLLHPSLVY